MDILHNLIKNLNSKEIKMVRNKLMAMISGNKYTQLFDYLLTNDVCDDVKISRKIYGEARTAGYYKLWSRLAEKVEEYLMNQLNSSDNSKGGRISAVLALSQHQFSRNSFVPAIELANRAEKLATDSHHYQLLDIIYNLKLSHADILTEDIDLLQKRWRHNQQQLVLMGELNAAFARIRIELRDLKIRGGHFELEGTIRRILAEF
jgi:hypothetical protein